MTDLISFAFGLFKVIFFNILLSIDNVSIVALSIKDYSNDIAKKISFISLSISALIKIILSTILLNVLMLDWLPFRLICGIVLIKITWDLLKSHNNLDNLNQTNIMPSSRTYIRAIGCTILADLSMSLENIIAIAIFSDGKTYLIALGIMLSMPILLLGSHIILRLMKKYNLIMYIGVSALAYTAIAMILEDHLIVDYIPDIIAKGICILISLSVIVYGGYELKSKSSKIKTSESE